MNEAARTDLGVVVTRIAPVRCGVYNGMDSNSTQALIADISVPRAERLRHRDRPSAGDAP